MIQAARRRVAQQAERRGESDRRMMRAAARLIACKGVAGTSLAEVGVAAGYSRGLPVERYGTKLGLVRALLAATEMTERMAKGVPQANGTTMVEPRMDVKHVGSAVLYMANLPLDANVQFMTIMATKMPFVGRG